LPVASIVVPRYDVIAALVACPPAPMEMEAEADEPSLSDAQEAEERSLSHGAGAEESRSWLDTPNADLLGALSR